MIRNNDTDIKGQPGFYLTAVTGEPGVWVIHVQGGGAFALNAVAVLSRAAAEHPPGARRQILERICDAFIEARPYQY